MTVAKPEKAALVRMKVTISADSAVKAAQHSSVMPAMRTTVSTSSQRESTRPR